MGSFRKLQYKSAALIYTAVSTIYLKRHPYKAKNDRRVLSCDYFQRSTSLFDNQPSITNGKKRNNKKEQIPGRQCFIR
jgi:hypothetical protein